MVRAHGENVCAGVGAAYMALAPIPDSLGWFDVSVVQCCVARVNPEAGVAGV